MRVSFQGNGTLRALPNQAGSDSSAMMGERGPKLDPTPFIAIYCKSADSRAATSFSSYGFVRGLNSVMTLPSLPIRYLWKFQVG